jgi:hypothetical protein
MALHLKSMSRAAPAGRRLVPTLSRAGRHITRKLSRFPTVSLLPLSTGSPELDPTEPVWPQSWNRSVGFCWQSTRR